MKADQHVILGVGMDEASHDTLMHYGKERGYKVIFAEHGAQAIEMLARWEVDVFLIPGNLADMTGEDFIKRLKSDTRFQGIPVLVAADAHERALVERCLVQGAEDYLLTPFSPVLLNAAVQPIFEKQRLRDQLTNQAEALAAAEKLADITLITLPIGLALSEEENFDLLLEKILQEVKCACHADGGTLYLREENALKFAIMMNDSMQMEMNEHSDAASGISLLSLYDPTTGEPNYKHVATSAAIRGETINIPDIYLSQDFDFSGTKAFDQEHGYRTTSTLTIPLKRCGGEVTGVLQLINATDPESNKVVAFDAYMQQLAEFFAVQAAVVLNNRLLMEHQKDLLRFENELEIARQIQLSFLPETLPQPPGWEIAACFHPAREVAGDFYDAFTLDNDQKVAFVIADVCDKGVGPALFMALIRTLLRAFTKYNPSRELMDNKRALGVELTNEYICQNQIETSMFATAFTGLLDVASGVLYYVNCGHNPPYILGPNGLKTALKPTAPVLGAFPGVKFPIHQVTLEPGDLLFTFTDGLPEARDPSGAFFTNERILNILAQPISSVAVLLQQMDAYVHAHIADAKQFDDITMLLIRRLPE
ncbi:protein serine phosphatase with GAF(S) sensor(S) [Candidatus Vecturithrix granuli]|uniref:Protein serine phosphatase with GAF(S) sensor(S) n=1 Tax=Vecturithrix granuli TaxID=1499967 RepID=A0A0S6WBY2_VECG1|nr:protein serine phosphatase with GAF(S) sensor(S) [Candidatus Vecturithrix granuli]